MALYEKNLKEMLPEYKAEVEKLSHRKKNLRATREEIEALDKSIGFYQSVIDRLEGRRKHK